MMRPGKGSLAHGAAHEPPPAVDGIEPAVEWLHRQGHRVVISPSAVWYDAAPGILQSFPFHPVARPSEEELRRLLLRGRAWALRYSAPVEAPVGKVSYHVVCARRDFGFEHVSRQTRQNVRKGMDHARIEPVSFVRLAEEGWALRSETLARQGRSRAEDQAWWKRLCLSAEGLPGFEAWGALHDGKLVAALVAYLARGCFQMLYQQSLTDHLRFGVNNALGFVFTQNALSRPDVRQLFYGLESLDASWEVDEFKFRMGYSAEPVRQRVVFHPVLRPFAGRAALRTVEFTRRVLFRGPSWHKAAGMMRFYLEGLRPAAEQNFAKCLPPVVSERHHPRAGIPRQ